MKFDFNYKEFQGKLSDRRSNSQNNVPELCSHISDDYVKRIMKTLFSLWNSIMGLNLILSRRCALLLFRASSDGPCPTCIMKSKYSDHLFKVCVFLYHVWLERTVLDMFELFVLLQIGAVSNTKEVSCQLLLTY